MPGLSLPLEQDLSAYKKKIKVAGIRMPSRMVAFFGMAAASSAIVGCWMVLALGLDPAALSFVFPAMSIVFFVAGFYEHNDFTPEQYLPAHISGMLSGRATCYKSSIYLFYEIPSVKEDHLEKKYRKARKKRGTRSAEVYLSRIEEAKGGGEARG